MIGEARLAKSNAALVLVENQVALLEPDNHGIQVGIDQIPFSNSAEIAECYFICDRICTGRAGRNALRRVRKDTIAIAQFGLKGDW